ncbi:copper homeostasis CutC domain-containing protein [Pelagophyceae sp. CCMP2097]|nr:copper homeostasis CutC domain-containing protein [Pelagophyceae sp. CCMP2097]
MAPRSYKKGPSPGGQTETFVEPPRRVDGRRIKSAMQLLEDTGSDSYKERIGRQAAQVALSTEMASSIFIRRKKRIRLRRTGAASWTHTHRLAEESEESCDLGILVENADAAVAAADGGARRIELFNCLSAGAIDAALRGLRGTAPWVKAHVHLEPPRARADRRTSGPARATEWKLTEWGRVALQVDVAMARTAGAASVVIGPLDGEGRIDVDFVQRLIRIAHPMRISWCRESFEHAAQSPLQSLTQLAQLRVAAIYTCGGPAESVWANVLSLRELNTFAQRANVEIVALSGVSVHNAHVLAERTGVTAVVLDARAEPIWGPMAPRCKRRHSNEAADAAPVAPDLATHNRAGSATRASARAKVPSDDDAALEGRASSGAPPREEARAFKEASDDEDYDDDAAMDARGSTRAPPRQEARAFQVPSDDDDDDDDDDMAFDPRFSSTRPPDGETRAFHVPSDDDDDDDDDAHQGHEQRGDDGAQASSAARRASWPYGPPDDSDAADGDDGGPAPHDGPAPHGVPPCAPPCRAASPPCRVFLPFNGKKPSNGADRSPTLAPEGASAVPAALLTVLPFAPQACADAAGADADGADAAGADAAGAAPTTT